MRFDAVAIHVGDVLKLETNLLERDVDNVFWERIDDALTTADVVERNSRSFLHY